MLLYIYVVRFDYHYFLLLDFIPISGEFIQTLDFLLVPCCYYNLNYKKKSLFYWKLNQFIQSKIIIYCILCDDYRVDRIDRINRSRIFRSMLLKMWWTSLFQCDLSQIGHIGKVRHPQIGYLRVPHAHLFFKFYRSIIITLRGTRSLGNMNGNTHRTLIIYVPRLKQQSHKRSLFTNIILQRLYFKFISDSDSEI